jgi:hypothetical protein
MRVQASHWTREEVIRSIRCAQANLDYAIEQGRLVDAATLRQELRNLWRELEHWGEYELTSAKRLA